MGSGEMLIKVLILFTDCDTIGHVRYINILTWLRGFRPIQMSWLVCSQRKNWCPNLGSTLAKTHRHPKRVVRDILWAENIFPNDEGIMVCHTEWLFTSVLLNTSHSTDQYRYIKIQPKAKDLNTSLWGINPINSEVTLQSLVLRSILQVEF